MPLTSNDPLSAISKHAVERYSQALDHEVRGYGMRVVLVEQNYTRTTFESNALAFANPLVPVRSIKSPAEPRRRPLLIHQQRKRDRK